MAEYTILKPPPKRRRRTLVAALVAVAVVAVGAGAFLAGRHDTSAPGTSTRPTTTATTHGEAAVPLTVATTPGAGAVDVPSDQAVSVTLSAPVRPGWGQPTFNPPVPGSWHQAGPTTLRFTAGAPFIPTRAETLTVPGGPGGPRTTSGRMLPAPFTVTFTVAQASTERLQQLLAQLDYLPLTFTPAAPVSGPAEAATAQVGTFAWRWPSQPPSLTGLWNEGAENVITKGALMAFENQSGLTVDGLAGVRVWSTLLADLAATKVNTVPYVYVFVSKQLPEALTLFQNGVPTLVNIPVNTGAPGADTANGTYPVFEHVVSSRMQGTNPDGSTYDDPNVPWASYFNGGDALHGFVRASYGSYQSNGCVEMAIADAAKVWPLTPIGTLVTVVGPVS
jgi:peptidoglycan hydrolase-like protein with peptidoglycan-binding domain